MFWKKKKEEEPKNPVTKEYSLWSNLCFIFSNMFHNQKALLFFIPLGILVQPIVAYLWTFTSKYIIELITNSQAVCTGISGFPAICL